MRLVKKRTAWTPLEVGVAPFTKLAGAPTSTPGNDTFPPQGSVEQVGKLDHFYAGRIVFM